MKWYCDLYIGDSIYHKKNKIIKNIKSNKFQPDIFILCAPLNKNNTMDIIPSFIFLQKSYKEKEIYIFGIAEGYNEALIIMEKIIMDCYISTGEFNIEKLAECR